MKKASYALFALLVVFALSVPAMPAQAAALTSLSDTLTSIQKTTAANHAILFTSPNGVAEGETITLTFDADFNMGSVAEDDVDVEDDAVDLTTGPDCTLTEQASVVVVGQVMTITICAGDGGAIAGTSVIGVKIGTNATGSGTGVNQITNPGTAQTAQIDIAGTQTDSGSLAVVIIDDETVAVTANVDPTITFSISDTSIGFGDLTTANARFATTDGTGADADSAEAFNMQLSTNADNGYAITYNGTTLTGTQGTISVATISNDANGTPGSEQFAMGFSTDGDATIAAAYDHNATPANRDWNFVASTTTTIASETGPTVTETISAFLLANIAGNTEAGSYSTSITYIATATF